ncbi:hypothetical protein [Streptomyces sp. CBMAI 2042]|nr:hypothetical protein [Streptomyces sp. CBMAI 2042]
MALGAFVGGSNLTSRGTLALVPMPFLFTILSVACTAASRAGSLSGHRLT